MRSDERKKDLRRSNAARSRRRGRTAESDGSVRLSVRNPEGLPTTGKAHFLRVVPSLQSGMKKPKKAADKAVEVPCVLRLVASPDRTVLEIVVEDEDALKLAAEWLKQSAR